MRLGFTKLPRPLHCVLAASLLLFAASLSAQAPPSSASSAPAPSASDAAPSADLEELVGRIALYPDDLLSIVLPGATFPLQIVEAERWIQQNKGNKEAKPKESWDDSVKALINYPDVVTMMNNDLDWTSALGEAVAADQTAVMDAVQAFRRKAEGAGNLKTDDKQIVEVEEDVVKIVQADPQVIYVPTYEPQVVVVQQPAPVYPTYYPTPYPVYYYPYPPGYSFAAGFFWGATVAYAFNWHGGSIHNDVNINVNRNTNINNIDRNTSINNRPTNIDRSTSNQMAQQGRGSWQSGQSPSDVRQGRTPTTTTRPANTGGGAQAGNRAGTANTGAGAANRAGTTPAQRPAAGAAGPQTSNTAANRSTTSSGSRYNTTSRNASTARSSPPSQDAFSGMSSGRSVSAQSSRGGASRGGGGGGGGRGGGGRR